MSLSALITISTRASLKRYHTFTLTLGTGEHGDEWEFQRIGTESEKTSVEKELAELRERLAKVEEWEVRRKEIEDELKRVWVKTEEGGGELEAPGYLGDEGEEEGEDVTAEQERGDEVEVEESSRRVEGGPHKSGEEANDEQDNVLEGRIASGTTGDDGLPVRQ